MKRFLIPVGAWATATVAAAVVAWAAVGIVGDQVSRDLDLPLTAAEVEEISAARVTSSLAATTTVGAPTQIEPSIASTASTTTMTVVPGSTVDSTTTTTASSATTASPATTASTTTTVTATPPVTTAPPTEETTRAIRVDGGSVVIRWSVAGGVRVTSATPDSGWSVEIEKGGPPSVEVKFEGPGEAETEVHVEVADGDLKIEVET